MSELPRVALILTGGTISSLGASRLDLAWYPEHDGRLTSHEMISAVPELAEFATVEESTFRQLSSHALTVGDWLDLAATVRRLVARDDCAGVVVTHGTNTLEETAYFLQLTVDSEKPVVFTGAMRPPSALGADGFLNLVRAVQVAASPDARGHGVLVVMNDRIHAARDVTKTITSRTDTFVAPDSGPLGFTDADGRVVFYHRHVYAAAHPFAAVEPSTLPRVDIVVSYVGADATFVEAAIGAGARGIVCAATGAGRATPEQEDALDIASDNGVVVCYASRTGAGRVPWGSPARAVKAVMADNLPAWKAKVLLSLALTRTTDLTEIQEIFDNN